MAHVQRDAVDELPPGVEAAAHPVADGVRRALLGLTLRTGAGLLHGLDVDLPLRHRGPTVVTVHDLSVFDVPWAHSRLRSRGEQALVARSLRRADAIVAVSGFTAERVRERFGREATVTHLAPSADMQPASSQEVERVRERYGLGTDSVLCVGTIEPRKRVPLLAQACEKAGVALVLAGGLGDGGSVPSSARHLGYVPAEDLPALYAAAAVVAYVSTYEGFGLPPVEAMACGGAVVATRVGALSEVLEAEAADALVPPDDVDALASALRTAVRDADHNAALRAAGLRAVGHLGWERTAATTLGVYRSLGVPC